LTRITSSHISRLIREDGAVAGDAGIVDHHIDRAELGLDLANALVAGVIVAHIPFIRRDAGALGEGLGLLVIARIVGGDGHPRIPKRKADRLADAAGSPRHDRYACHAFLSSLG
jgi:hypothetical protein